MDAVGAVDVSKPRRPEHHGIALGPAPEAVRRGIGVVIGLHLDDPPAHPVNGEGGPDQVGRHFVDRTVEKTRGCRLGGGAMACVLLCNTFTTITP